ncbi:MAG: MBL fold metallo-hydrolase [Patescibacteria group bacterium]
MKKSKKIILSFYATLTIVLLLTAAVLFFQLQPANLQIYFFDVGQGDSIFIKTPNRYNILIDGGVNNLVLYKLGKYLPFYDRTIDLVILTHPDSDHLVGLIEVLKRYQVKNILLTKISDDSAVYKSFWQTIKDKNLSVLVAGDVKGINLGQEVSLSILYPQQSLAGKNFKEKNDSSIVVKLNYNHFSSLFTGDAPIKIEDYLLASKIPISTDVLKLGHHGSNTCSSQNFLIKAKPDLAIISFGVNKFGHPSPQVLQRLEQLKISWLSTFAAGDIIIHSDGQKFWR